MESPDVAATAAGHDSETLRTSDQAHSAQTDAAGLRKDECNTCWDLTSLGTNSRHSLARPSLLLLLGTQPTAGPLLRQLHF